MNAIASCRPTYETRDGCPARYHGTYSATRKAGCVCPEAIAHRRAYFKRQQFGRLVSPFIDPTGTRRRIQALAAIGWPAREVLARIGWSGTPGSLMYGSRRIHRTTATSIAAVYDQLWGRPGGCNRARAAARRNGWAPPLAWDEETIDDPAATPNWGAADDPLPDEVAVERAAAGHLTWGQLNDAERAEAIRRLRTSGLSLSATCLQLAVSASQYRRWAAVHLAESAVAA